jgi:hypothetical protein
VKSERDNNEEVVGVFRSGGDDDESDCGLSVMGEEEFNLRSNLYNEAAWGSFYGDAPSVCFPDSQADQYESTAGKSIKSSLANSAYSGTLIDGGQRDVHPDYSSHWLDKREGNAYWSADVHEIKQEEEDEEDGEDEMERKEMQEPRRSAFSSSSSSSPLSVKTSKRRNRNACTVCKKAPCERCRKTNGVCVYQPVRTRGPGVKTKMRKMEEGRAYERMCRRGDTVGGNGDHEYRDNFAPITSFARPMKQQRKKPSPDGKPNRRD